MRNVATLVNYLARNGFSVHVITMEGDIEGRDFLDNDVTWESLLEVARGGKSKIRCKLRLMGAVRAALDMQPFDLLYVIDSWTLPILFGAYRGRLAACQAPLVYHTYDWLEPGLAPRPAIWLERQVCRRAALVVNTDRSRARLQQTLYRLGKMPLTVPNLLSRDEKIPKRDTRVRRNWFGEREGTLKILVYPSVASEARLTLELIRAFALLPLEFTLVTFLGPGGYGRQCRRVTRELGLEDRIRFLDPVPYTALLSLVIAADLGAIFHDATESSGYFMANADRLGLFAACGIPFIASDYPNMEAVVYRHGLGVCCNSFSHEAIAEAVQNLCPDRDSLAARSRKVRHAFTEELHFERRGSNLLDALHDLLPASIE